MSAIQHNSQLNSDDHDQTVKRVMEFIKTDNAEVDAEGVPTDPAYVQGIVDFVMAENLTVAVRPPVYAKTLQDTSGYDGERVRAYKIPDGGICQHETLYDFQLLPKHKFMWFDNGMSGRGPGLEFKPRRVDDIAAKLHLIHKIETAATADLYDKYTLRVLNSSMVDKIQPASQPNNAALYLDQMASAQRYYLEHESPAPAMPTIHLTNFGHFEADKLAPLIARSNGTVFITPTWDARRLEDLTSNLNTFPLLRTVIFGAVYFGTSADPVHFHPEKMLSGLISGHTGPLRRLKAMAKAPFILPIDMLRKLNFPDAYLARQITIESELLGECYPNKPAPHMQYIVLRRVSSPDVIEIVSARDGGSRLGARDLKTYTPLEITRLCEAYLQRRREGLSEIKAMELVSTIDRTPKQHRNIWSKYQKKSKYEIDNTQDEPASWDNQFLGSRLTRAYVTY